MLIVNEMCATRKFSEVSVADICEEAGISRATFYRMFEDKYSLNNWCQAFNFAAGVRQIGRTYSWADGLFVAYSVPEFFSNIARASYRDQDERSNIAFSRRCWRACLSETLQDVRHIAITDELAFQIAFFADATSLSAPEYWLKGSGESSVRAFTDRLARCVPRELFEALDEPLDPQPPIAITAGSLARVARTVDVDGLLLC